MTDTYFPGIPGTFRVVPTHPEYAVTEVGEVLNLTNNQLQFPWEDSDGEDKLIIYVVDDETGRTRRTAIKVSDMVKSAFTFTPKDETQTGGNKLMKASELPVSTIIDDAVEGVYVRDVSGWVYLNPCCSDCGDKYFIKNEDADEKFKDFGIDAMSYRVVTLLATKLQDEY